MKVTEFRTHTGTTITGEALQAALAKVANDWRELAHAIRRGPYASHVTEEDKDKSLQSMLRSADLVQAGHITSLTMWQRINEAITGECVALFN